MSKIILIVTSAAMLFVVVSAQAPADCGPVGSGYRLCVPLPGQSRDVADIGDYTRMLYQFALAIAGVIVFTRIVYGGIIYSLSAGNTSKQADAKAIITQALWGLLLLLSAVLILYIINPNLLKLRLTTTGLRPEQVVDTSLPEIAPPTAVGPLGEPLDPFRFGQPPTPKEAEAPSVFYPKPTTPGEVPTPPPPPVPSRELPSPIRFQTEPPSPGF